MKTPIKKKLPRHCMVVYAPYPLGETRVQREAEALVKHGYEVDVICLRVPGSLPVDRYKGVTIYREKFNFFPGRLKEGLGYRFLRYIYFFFAAAFRLTLLYMRNPYTTIQVHNLPDFLVFCALIPKLSGAAILLDLHDLMPEFFQGHFGQDFISRRTVDSLARTVGVPFCRSCHHCERTVAEGVDWERRTGGQVQYRYECSRRSNIPPNKK